MAPQRRRSHSLGNSLAGALALLAFMAAALLSAAPQLHERLHADADAPSHVCAVTLITAGLCQHATLPPVSAPRRGLLFLDNLPVTPAPAAPVLRTRSVLEHAPPACA